MTLIVHNGAQPLVERGYILLVLTVLSLTCWLTTVTAPSSIENCVLWNAALCKPADQISSFKSATGDRAVDGNRNPEFYGLSCFHTNSYYSNNWWMVDLMDEYLVHKVVITNRGDSASYPKRFIDVFIDLFTSNPKEYPSFPDNNGGVRCITVNTTFEGTKSFDCATPTYARYMKMLKTADGYFHACEVEVMVSKKRGDPECRRMVTKHFSIVKNSMMGNGVVVESTIASTAEMCLQLCTVRGDLCNGFYWTEMTRDCQMVSVNPYDVGSVVGNIGTDFYVESRVECLGNGTWKYV